MTINGDEISPAITQAERDKLNNAPDDISADLALLMPRTSSNINLSMTNAGTGNAYLEFINTVAAVNHQRYKINARSGDLLRIESMLDNGNTDQVWSFFHNGTTEFPGTLTLNGNAVVDVTNTTFANLPSDTNAELSLKADLISPALTGTPTQNGNNIVDVANTTFSNLPTDTTAQLALKANNSGQVFTGPVQATVVGVTQTNAEQLLALGNGGATTGNSGIAWRVGTTNDARTGNYRARAKYDYDTNSLDLMVGNSPNHASLPIVVQLLTDAINLNQNVAITGTLSSSSATDINAVGGLIADAATVKSYVDANAGNFDGGTITNPLIVESAVDDKKLLTLKRTDNTRTLGLAWQNSGSNYIKSIYVDETANESLKIDSGSDADINNLLTVVEIFSDGTLHAQGDIFAFNGGNLAGNDVSSVGSFVGTDYRLNGSATDSNWALYKATQGATNGPEGTQAASGVSFSGEAARVRVANNTNQGFMVENGIGLNLFEINGSTGNARFNNQVAIDNDLTVTDEGRIIGGLSVGLDTAPSNALDVYGALFVTGNALYKANLTLENLAQDNFTFERRADGIALRAETNPANGDPIFQVESSGNSPRLRVEHLGFLSTSNPDMKVGIANDGTGGNLVVHEGNWQSITDQAVYYFQTFPTLTATDIASWAGKDIYFIGVGTGTITLPVISNTPTTAQIRSGVSFNIHNFNSGADITMARSGGNQFVIDNVGNVSSANQTIFTSTAIRMNALDLSAYPTVGSFAFLYSGIS